MQSAVNSAQGGDEVRVPAGTCVWTGSVTINKPITIIGADLSGGGRNLIASATMSNGFFLIAGFSSSSLVRVSGFVFHLIDNSGYGIYVEDVDLSSLRIDKNTFHHGATKIFLPALLLRFFLITMEGFRSTTSCSVFRDRQNIFS